MSRMADFGNDLYTGRRSIDFVGKRRTWYAISLVALLIALAGRLVGSGDDDAVERVTAAEPASTDVSQLLRLALRELGR